MHRHATGSADSASDRAGHRPRAASDCVQPGRPTARRLGQVFRVQSGGDRAGRRSSGVAIERGGELLYEAAQPGQVAGDSHDFRKSRQPHYTSAAGANSAKEASKSPKRFPCTTTCSRKASAAESASPARMERPMESCSSYDAPMRFRTRSCKRR